MPAPQETPHERQSGPRSVAGLASVPYLTGFGNQFETEALPGALPVGRNSPQRCAYGLYAEQLSGSPFTAPRQTNERSWLYRIRPTVQHIGRFRPADARLWRSAPCADAPPPPAPMRWDPLPMPEAPQSFIEGMTTITTAGDAGAQAGMAVSVYLATRAMQDEYFYNADAEMLVVAQQGRVRFATEFGELLIEPGEVAILPRAREVPGGPAGRRRPAAMCARTTAARSPCRSAARSAPTASPTHATS